MSASGRSPIFFLAIVLCLTELAPAGADGGGKAPPGSERRSWAILWNPAPTVVALIEGSAEVAVEAQTVVAEALVLETLLDVAARRDLPPAVGVSLGAGYSLAATGLSGPIVGLYPGYLFFLSRDLPGAFALSTRVQQQWLSAIGLMLSAGIGVSYLFQPLDLFKWDLSLGIGFAFKPAR